MMKNNIKLYCLFFTAWLAGASNANAQDLEILDSTKLRQEDSLVNVAFGKVAPKDLLGGVSSVNISKLLEKSYGTYSLENLQSFVGGYTGSVWGQNALVIIDGVPRRAEDVRMVEVESVSVLKGASAVALYGSNAAKGVILITTRRGEQRPLTIDVRANTGVNVPKRYAEYLNAAEYMTLYNEASRNDGVTQIYSPELIYNTASGSNPYRYPDLKFFTSDYLKKGFSRSDITTEIHGGNERTRYYSNIGLSHNGSILNYGDARNNNDVVLNIRGNVDMTLTKWLSAYTNAVAGLSNNYTARGDFWGAAASMWPNRMSPFIPIDQLDPTNPDLQTIVQNSKHIIDGKYLLGGISTNTTNAFSDMLRAGYIKYRNRTFMFDVGTKADLGSLMKGLSFQASYNMDYTYLYNEAYRLDYATFAPTWSDIDGQPAMITGLSQFGLDGNQTNEYIGENTYTATMSARGQFDYQRSFAGGHNVMGKLLAWGYQARVARDEGHEGSVYHPTRNTNLGFQAAYNFKQKYYFDFSAAAVHSAKLPPGKRDAISPTVTLGWRVSDENFFKNDVVTNLKLFASYGSLKQDIDISDYYLYQGYFNPKGWYGDWPVGAGTWRTIISRGSNFDLTYIERKEFRAGFEASFFGNVVNLEANYFQQNTNGLLSQTSSLFPSYFSGGNSFSLLPWVNYNNEQRKGLDFSVNMNKKFGEVSTSLGLAGMFFNSEVLKRDEVYNNDYLYRAGRPLDASFALIAEGIFQNQEEIDNHARQTFSAYKPGDIKYKDVNGDGIIDNNDQVQLGKAGWGANPFTFGVNLTVNWKRFTLFALGSGNTGAVAYKSGSYFWVNGATKYSDVVLGRTIIDKNANGSWEVVKQGSYPALTTTGNSNNFRNSTYWMYKTDRFNLTRVQLTYDLDQRLFKNSSFLHALKIYVQGDNLLVLAKERALMETNFGGGPQYRFYNLGVKATF
ncbi:SusC/RagA family TonB-linked outer membrane protein [Niabella yanshanensis]|uniref:SusC/RagA family TonB-linked outer membrane protein n=2 Tax=Niabella yanshanensis TaxID=577386 RepID=A0ABZ0W633_9BACT|nr:SusC/RagA family TonB-linked outer membrane protein [Niabella yanshanensis]